MDRLVSSSNYRLDIASAKMFAVVTRRPCDRTRRFSNGRQRMPCSTEPEFPYESSSNEIFKANFLCVGRAPQFRTHHLWAALGNR